MSITLHLWEHSKLVLNYSEFHFAELYEMKFIQFKKKYNEIFAS